MHALPFGGTLTDALVAVLRDACVKCGRRDPDFLPSLTWSTITRSSSAPVEQWGNRVFSRTHMRVKDIFIVEDVSFCMAPDDQARAQGHILDWKEGLGVIETSKV